MAITTTPETQIALNPQYRYTGIKPKRLNSFPAVSYGGRSTLKIPTGDTFDCLLVSTNLPLERLMTTIRLNNSAIYNNIPADFFKMLHQYKMLAPSDELQEGGKNVFVIPFTDLAMNTRVAMEQTALVTMIGETLELQVDIGQKEADDPEVPSISAFALINMQTTMVRQFLPRIERMNIELHNDGLNQYTNLTNNPVRAIRRMHFKTPDVESIDIRRDGQESYEMTRWSERYLASEVAKAWQEGYTHLDFVMRGFINGEMFPTARARELLFDITTSKALGAVEVFVEYLDVERIAQQAVAS